VALSFDPAKDDVNRAKHGVSLAGAEMLEWEAAVVFPDERTDYGEERVAAIGYIGQRLYVVIFTDRGEERRIISLRKANAREIKRYAEA
jgi:uncharacterized DUF497 family protein